MSILRLCEQAWTARYATKGDPQEADCIIGFAFGIVQEGTRSLPGAANEKLALIAHENYPEKQKILQWEIADAYERIPAGDSFQRIERHRKAGKYLDTREVAEQAFQFMQQRGWLKAVILAHPNHIPRVNAVCERLGIQTVLPPGLESVPFDPASAQSWTRGRKSWFVREVPTIVYYRSKGWT